MAGGSTFDGVSATASTAGAAWCRRRRHPSCRAPPRHVQGRAPGHPPGQRRARDRPTIGFTSRARRHERRRFSSVRSARTSGASGEGLGPCRCAPEGADTRQSPRPRRSRPDAGRGARPSLRHGEGDMEGFGRDPNPPAPLRPVAGPPSRSSWPEPAGASTQHPLHARRRNAGRPGLSPGRRCMGGPCRGPGHPGRAADDQRSGVYGGDEGRRRCAGHGTLLRSVLSTAAGRRQSPRG